MSQGKRKDETSDTGRETDKDNGADRDRKDRQSDFSWYSGKVDETVVREIVRLKREHKL